MPMFQAASICRDVVGRGDGIRWVGLVVLKWWSRGGSSWAMVVTSPGGIGYAGVHFIILCHAHRC